MPQLTLIACAVLLLIPQPQQSVDPQLAGQSPPVDVAAPQQFAPWLEGLMAEARDRGFSTELVTEALGDLEPLPRVVANDRTQAELTLTFDRYYRTRVTAQTVRRGRELARQYQTLLARIERTYGVPRAVVLAIWGLESRFGRSTGRTPVFQALATLAWEPRRAAFFRGQLFDALTMVSRGYIDVSSMTGSWAGAMGQTQFMPSSYLQHAVDFDEDGHRDIWRSTPDALASIANYLRGYGWDTDYTWGREVRVPAAALTRVENEVPARTDGCYAMRDMTERRPLNDWRRFGVSRVDGGPLPNAMIPAGLATLGARSFLLYPNYDVILGYNCAHHYALSVALLSERLR
jgi:membrane-bound lytic murein transglycosylase B